MGNSLDQLRKHYDATGRDDLDESLTIFAPDVETVTPNGTLKGIEAFRAMGETFRAALSDMRHEIVRSYEVGDTVVVEALFTGHHTGPMVTPESTIPASGNRIVFPYADFLTFEDGLCTSHRIYWDNVALLTQLGALG